MATANPIGLDIGSSSIRAVEARRGKDDHTLINFGQVPLPPGAVQGGVVQDPAAVTAALKQLWAASKFGTRQVSLGVTNPQLVVREMSVSNLPAKELHKSLPFQVRDMLPLAVDRSLLDFHPLEEPGDNPTVRGLLIAMPKEAVIVVVDAVEKAGLHVAGVDLASFALLRAASRLDSQVEAIVDIGAQVTSVVVHADGEPLIVRTVPRGGGRRTAPGQRDPQLLHVPRLRRAAEARHPAVAVRRQCPHAGPGGAPAGAAGRLGDVRRQRRPAARHPPRPAARLRQFRAVGRRVDRPDPGSGSLMATTLMPLDPATSPQRAARVLPIAAHLLPDEVIAARRARKVRSWVLVVLGVVAVLLGSWYALVALQANNAEEELQGVTLEQTLLQRKQTEFKEVTDVRAETAAINGRLATLLAEDLRWSTLLDTLRTTGADSAIKITAVSGALSSSASGTGAAPSDRLPTTGGKKVVGTLTVTGEAPDKNSVARYVDALGNVALFANPYLTNAAEATGTVQFSLSLDITADALGGRFSPTTPPAPAASATTPGGK